MTVDPEVVRVLEAGYRAYGGDRGADFGDFGAFIDPDLEWVEGGLAPEAGLRRGRESFERWAQSWIESFDDFRLEPLEAIVEGDAVVVVLRQSGRGRASGVPFTTDLAHVWHIRGLRAVRWESYARVELALAALRSPASD
ncbi:MAG: nuclear transport factor 2 family protein [Thermoleophilaceae bacterium]